MNDLSNMTPGAKAIFLGDQISLYQLATSEYLLFRSVHTEPNGEYNPITLLTRNGKHYQATNHPVAVITFEKSYGVITRREGKDGKVIWEEQAFSLHGIAKGSPIKLNFHQLLARETVINTDIDGDQKVGNVITNILDNEGDYGLYETKLNQLVISDNGLEVGNVPPNPLILKSPFSLFTPRDAVKSLLEYSNGTFGVVYQQSLKWHEATFSSTGTFLRITQLNQSQLMNKEYLMSEDIDNDSLIGDVISEILDNNGMVGLFRTKSGTLVIDESTLIVGSTVEIPTILMTGPNLFNPRTDPTQLLEYDDGSYGVIIENAAGWSEIKFSGTGMSSGTPTVLSTRQLVNKEIQFAKDIDKDGVIGDKVISVYVSTSTGPNGSHGMGLYGTKAGAIVIDEAFLDVGQATIDPTILKLGNALYKPKITPSGLMVYEDGKFGVLINRGAHWTEQIFNSKGFAEGTTVKISVAQMLERERILSIDIDSDHEIGDTIGKAVDQSGYKFTVGDHEFGLFTSSRGNAYYIDHIEQSPGSSLSEIARPLRFNESKFWTPGALGIIGMSEIGNGEIEVLLSKSSNEFLVQSFQSETGLATGKMQTINKKNLLAREFYYDQDLNNDQIISLIGLSESPDNWA